MRFLKAMLHAYWANGEARVLVFFLISPLLFPIMAPWFLSRRALTCIIARD